MEEKLVEFLYYAHSFNFLDKRIVDGLSIAFGVNVVELCKGEGITYNI